MKTLLSILATLCLVFNLQAKPAEFSYDTRKVDAEFGQLNKLENYVTANPNATIADTKAASMASSMDLDLATVDVAKELPANIPAFWWGFCLTWVGLIVVYVITDNDKDQVKKALKGCIISSVVGLVVYLIAVVGVFATATSGL